VNDADLSDELPKPAFKIEGQTRGTGVVRQHELAWRNKDMRRLAVLTGRRKRLRGNADMVADKSPEDPVNWPCWPVVDFRTHRSEQTGQTTAVRRDERFGPESLNSLPAASPG
jgi:hypothetical protein